MDPGEFERGRAVVGQGVADTAVGRVDQVFFRVAGGPRGVCNRWDQPCSGYVNIVEKSS